MQIADPLVLRLTQPLDSALPAVFRSEDAAPSAGGNLSWASFGTYLAIALLFGLAPIPTMVRLPPLPGAGS